MWANSSILGRTLTSKGRWLGSAAIAMAAGVIIPAPLYAQAVEDQAEEPGDEAQIIVTGSRLNRANVESPIPVITVSRQELEDQAATTAGDLLRELPSVGFGANRFADNGVGAPSTLGTTLVSLRFLGPDRTLTLVDGRRHVGSIAGSTSVDVDSIPTALIKRIEVSTGGATVAYGADAVAGVVNIITDRKFTGIQFDARAGDSHDGGAAEQNFELTAGTNFADDRGNIAVNLGYSNSGVLRANQREWLRRQQVLVPNPADTGPDDGIPDQILVENGRLATTNFNGLMARLTPGFALDFDNQLTFDDDGNVIPYDEGTATGGTFNIGGLGLNLADLQTIANPRERFVAQANTTIEASDNVTAFFDAKFYRVKSSYQGQPTGDFYTRFNEGTFFLLRADNPYLPFDQPLFANFYNTAPLNWVFYSRYNADLGFRTSEVTRDTYRFIGGLEGDFAEGAWTWSASYQFGRTSEERFERNNRIDARFALATDPTTDTLGLLGTVGAPVCRATLAAAAAGTLATASEDVRLCLPLNIFSGPGRADPAAIDYVRHNGLFKSSLTQNVLSAYIGGPLFALPHGNLEFSGGVEYRREKSNYIADPVSAAGRLFDSSSPSFAGLYEVKEAYAELAAPLLKDLPLVHELSVEAGIRASDYNTIGSTIAWRISGSYAPVEDLRFRITRSTAIRAPNISELFSPQSSGGDGIVDPCDNDNLNFGPNPAQRAANCAAELTALGLNPVTFDDPLTGITKTILTGGNPDLLEEKAKSLTIGAVFTPRFIPGFSASIDYFAIDVDNAIATESAQGIVNDCYDRFDSLDNPLCALFSRRPDGAIENVQATILNLAGFEVRGVDFDVAYQSPLARLLGSDKDLGEIALAVRGTYLDRLLTRASIAQSEPGIDDGEFGSPHWRFGTSLTYSKGPLAFNWTGRFIGGGVENVQTENLAEQQSPYRVGDVLIHDIQLRYDLGLAGFERTELYAGINNLTNSTPPALTRAGTTSAGSSALYDPIGRYYYAGVRVRL